MKKTILLIALIAVSFAVTGCATYKDTGAWAPDGANYTLSRDRQTGDLCDYWGLSWSFK